MKIWVHSDVSDGRITDVTFELLSKARDLADDLGGADMEATLIGSGVASEAGRLAEYGAGTVYLADAPSLALYSPLSHVPLLVGAVELWRPDIYLFAATSIGSALGPAVAARLRTGMAAHCVDLRINDRKGLSALVPSFGGRVIGEILCPNSTPQMASVKPGIFVKKPQASSEFRIVKLDIPEDASDERRLVPIGIERRHPKGRPLSEADVVICGGFGVGNKENWLLLEELAERLGGAAACTRPAVDEGWCEENRMVGTSGQSIRPKVYLGFGVSGATHHVCGMNEACVVISINRDEGAPIFEVSDFRVVADLNRILPLLMDAVRPSVRR
ncbi:MAG: electron transfer flavoprotein subunit alpha/FixB family protein [Synergistaceae bacterium]|jgi:electron transfer flavoprotein alpha subunit|nr:electron transfer flavoprotein subunit alpha/FixB family protein [Synergistaceae bacterium]